MSALDFSKIDSSSLGSSDSEKLLTTFKGYYTTSEKSKQAWESAAKLNIAYYYGYQHVDMKSITVSGTTTNRMTINQDSDVIKPVSNKINYYSSQFHSWVMQSDPIPKVLPATDDDADLLIAEVADAWLTTLIRPNMMSFEEVNSDVQMQATITGKGFFKWYFDKDRKQPAVASCSPLDIFTDPAPPNFNGCRWIIHKQFLDRESVYENYDVRLKEADLESPDHKNESVMRAIGLFPEFKGVTVYELWMRPCNKYPSGVYAVWCKDKFLVHPTKFPYNHGHLPFTYVGQTMAPGSQHHRSFVEFARPIQDEQNIYHQQRFIGRENMANAKWFVDSAMDMDEIDRSTNQVVNCNTLNGQLPFPKLVQGTIMADSGDGEYLSNEMMDIVGLHETSQGQVPGRVEAAQAISLLREADQTRLQEQLRTTKVAISEGFWQILQLTKQFVPEETVVESYSRDGVPQVHKFYTSQLKEGMQVDISMGTGLAKSYAARQDQLMGYWDKKIITDPVLMTRLLDLPTPSVTTDLALDIRQAENENIKMAQGVFITPAEWDNHGIHLTKHYNFMKTQEFNKLDEVTRKVFIDHCEMHKEEELKQLQEAQKQAALAQPQQPGPQGPPASPEPPIGGQ